MEYDIGKLVALFIRAHQSPPELPLFNSMHLHLFHYGPFNKACIA